MKEIAAEFRQRGKIVLMGGPQATLRSDLVRPHCDILVRGEIEEIGPQLFADLQKGVWRDEYFGGKADLTKAPLPRLDLCATDRVLGGAVQTSRGCPFGCEFCDIIQFQGRKQRFKKISQVIAELDQLYRAGLRSVFITDDNLTVNKPRAKRLMSAIADWNSRQEFRVEFSAQVSIELSDDEELLHLCARAGVNEVFVGIETPNMESLAEVKKFNNTKFNLREQVDRFVAAGISVMGGMMVGFDSDGPDIFARQYEFAMSLPVPFFTPVTLFAPETTPLYARLAREGRITGGSADVLCVPWETNIVPAQMSCEDLIEGLRWLCNNLYSPKSFEKRVKNFARKVGQPEDSESRESAPLRQIEKDSLAILKQLPHLGISETLMGLRLSWLALREPAARTLILRYLLMYLQVRHMFDRGNFWDPTLIGEAGPAIGRKGDRQKAA
jgi:hypothetical protein